MQRPRAAMLGILCFAFAASAILGACKKEAPSLSGTNTAGEAGANLERRIADFYSRMKSIHENRAAYKNAKVTDNVYISVDSAEFLIEATYNYEVAGTDDDSSDVTFHGFSFTVPIPNDSILSESEASAFMYQIKDSIMAVYDTISYSNKRLALFDLEIEHAIGTFEATFDVHYSIVVVPRLRPSGTLFDGSPNDVWAVLPAAPCSSSFPFYIMPGRQLYQNAYFNGTSSVNHSITSPNASFPSCSNPGAAVELRRYGISNYYAGVGAPTPALLKVNIGKHQTDYAYTAANSDYVNRGYTPTYDHKDQYFTWVPSSDGTSGGGFTTSGVNFYSQWLNPDMMNFYLGYIPGKIATAIPAGRTFHDFQITYIRSFGSGTFNPVHVYFTFYGVQTQVTPSQGPLALS